MEKLDKIPRLFYVRNLDTMEEFKIFARNKDEAVSCCYVELDAKLEVGEVRVTTEDGCTNAIFQLRSLPVTEGGSFFRTVNANTLKVGKTVYLKQIGDYDRSTLKYCCSKYNDYCSSRRFKPQQWVITEFTF